MVPILPIFPLFIVRLGFFLVNPCFATFLVSVLTVLVGLLYACKVNVRLVATIKIPTKSPEPVTFCSSKGKLS